MIERNTLIEDLVEKHPKAVRFLMLRGIRCIACGEPMWGTLESAAKQKGYRDDEITQLVKDLNQTLHLI